MIFSMHTWLLPAIAAGSASYLVCLVWERIRSSTAPSGLLSALLAALSFCDGRNLRVLPAHSFWT